MRTARTGKRGFSLVELVIVIVIIGIIAAIAIPRVGRGARGASESALSSNLSVMRNAIELYAGEHSGVYPGAATDGSNGPGAESLVSQLTKFSSVAGATSDTRDADHPFGPYLRKGIPALPVGANAGSNTVLIQDSGAPAVSEGGGEGWVYNPNTGEFIANSGDTPDTGTKAYNEY